MRSTLTLLLVCLMSSLVMAQNPKPPTRLPVDIIPTIDSLPVTDQVVLAIQGTNLTVYIDSTSNPDDQNKLTTLEIKWEGEGPGFNERTATSTPSSLVISTSARRKRLPRSGRKVSVPCTTSARSSPKNGAAGSRLMQPHRPGSLTVRT